MTREKILIIRNDKIGDFMLIWPALALLKANYPQCELHALVPGYTRELAELCPWIDHVIIDPGQNSKGLRQGIRDQHYHAVITLFSTTRIGKLVWSAGIKQRYAPATKLAQIFYNRRLKQKRSHSIKAEFEYNQDLIRFFLRDRQISIDKAVQPPFMQFPGSEIHALKNQFKEQQQINADSLCFVHMGHGGSANNLSLQQYQQLASAILKDSKAQIIFTAGPGEAQAADSVYQALATQFPQRCKLFVSQGGLPDFARHIAFADVFIAGSTGPLHIAGALNRPTIGFYPRSRVNSSIRWATINDKSIQHNFSPPEKADADDMSTVNIQEAADCAIGLLT